jgi:hypothetical protein
MAGEAGIFLGQFGVRERWGTGKQDGGGQQHQLHGAFQVSVDGTDDIRVG